MTTLPLADVRANLSRIVDEAVQTHERVEITRNGRRAAVLLGADDYDSLMETLDILGDAELVRELASAEAAAERGEVFSLDQVTEEMRALGRPAAVTFRVELTRSVRIALTELLPEAVAVACLEFIRGPLAADPYRVGKPLREQLSGRYVARRGEFRIVYQIFEERIVVPVILVAHRRDVYR